MGRRCIINTWKSTRAVENRLLFSICVSELGFIHMLLCILRVYLWMVYKQSTKGCDWRCYLLVGHWFVKETNSVLAQFSLLSNAQILQFFSIICVAFYQMEFIFSSLAFKFVSPPLPPPPFIQLQVFDFESFIESLNDQGYLLKKGSRLYQLQTMWEELLQ